MRRLVAVVLFGAACGKANAPRAADSSKPAAPAPVAATGQTCPPNGTWAECSVIYRLERAGVAPRIDSIATPNEPQLGGTPLMLKIGISAQLEVHLYADSAARVVAGAKLDRASFVNGTAPQTIKRERTLIESANIIALLTSINAHQRERVSDALTAGPPQPEQPPMLKPVKSESK